jgi:prepilin signal peptidase PulO-like enzyme (type II secretory pathway)
MGDVIQRPSRRLSLLPWSLCLVTLGLVATMSVLVLLNLATINNPDEANLIELVLSVSFAVLGALVASRQPANAVGWAFLSMAVLTALAGVSWQYTRYSLTSTASRS